METRIVVGGPSSTLNNANLSNHFTTDHCCIISCCCWFILNFVIHLTAGVMILENVCHNIVTMMQWSPPVHYWHDTGGWCVSSVLQVEMVINMCLQELMCWEKSISVSTHPHQCSTSTSAVESRTRLISSMPLATMFISQLSHFWYCEILLILDKYCKEG